MENKLEDFVKSQWDLVIDYEKSWLKSHEHAVIPVVKIIDYFGIENICKLHGCTIVDEEIAKVLIKKAFEK